MIEAILAWYFIEGMYEEYLDEFEDDIESEYGRSDARI